MVMTLSHRYCYTAINHSLYQNAQQLLQQSLWFVWNKVLPFVINATALCCSAH